MATLPFRKWQATVVVERPVAQLYGRIKDQLMAWNRKPYLGQPMTVSGVHEVSAAQFQRMLARPGVQHLRADATEKAAS